MATPGYLRYPTIFGEQVVFTAEDDLWLVEIGGGRAERLTAGVAEVTNARFSPDGAWLAFTGHDEGPVEVYVMPATGGPSQRLTYQGGNATVCGWQPDGSMILYASSARQPMPRWRMLSAIAPTGGEPVAQPYGIANAIAYGPHGVIVLGRNIGEPANWKRYRGGTAGYLWIDRQGDGDFTILLDLKSNIASPCFIGERIYFISDHEGMGDVYSCTVHGEDLRRHTQQQEFYARNLTSDGQRAVFHAGGDLFVIDGEQVRPVPVTLPGFQAQRGRKFVSAAHYLDSATLHPKGHTVALTTRGKAYSFANFEGAVIQHGATDGVRYRYATWLADGRHIVASSDDGTEPRLVVFAADGSEPDRLLDQIDIGHVVQLLAAPKGNLIVLTNHRNEIVLVDLTAATSKVLDSTPDGRGGNGALQGGLAWSPDALWVAYGFHINARQMAIKIANVSTGETVQVTDPVRYDMQPSFDPEGRYLYFLSARVFDPVRDQMQMELSFPKGVRPYLITLRNDLHSPFRPMAPALDEPTPPSDEPAPEEENQEGDDSTASPAAIDEPDETAESGASAASAEASPDAEATPTEEAATSTDTAEPPGDTLRIEFDGIMTRILPFPVAEGRYGRILGTPDGVLYSAFPVEGTLSDHWANLIPAAKGTIWSYSFEKYKTDTFVDGVSDFDLTADGRMVLYRAGDRLRVVKSGEKPPHGELAQRVGRESGWLDLSRVRVAVRPAFEWKQMFGEAWRLQREQFWVADMAGIDWRRIYERYAPLLERVASRSELSDLIWEMHGELGSSHAYEMGGEYRYHPDYRQGYLGADWHLDAETEAYIIDRIVRGDPWNLTATSALLIPGANVHVGDAIVAINGQRLSATRGPQQLLVDQAGNEVQLLIRPVGATELRRVTVRAGTNEYAARYRDWVEHNRASVHEFSGNRVGYVHIPNMGSEGFAEFHRYYLTEFDHEGLIVDVRWNGGGYVSSLILEKLARRRIGYDFQRWGPPEPYPDASPRGSVVALTNENAGSDGDMFSHAFKVMGLGPLIGKRTWGGVIGISPYITLSDGTITTVPEYAFWFQDVGWGLENYGTDPTIEVDYRPQDYAQGRDPQLDRALAETMRLVAEHPPMPPEPERRPDRSFNR